MNTPNPQFDAQLAALQAKRDAVMAKFANAFKAVEQRDPKFVEARMRQSVYSDYHDLHRPPEIKEFQRQLIPIDHEMNVLKQAKA